MRGFSFAINIEDIFFCAIWEDDRLRQYRIHHLLFLFKLFLLTVFFPANNPSDAITNPLALLTDQTSQLQSPSLVPTNKKANATCKTTKHPPTNTNNPPPVLAHPVVTSSPHLGSSNSSVDVGAGGEDSSSIMTQYEELKSKAMTSRARRIIANARERNRVHTISSAFEVI